MEDFKLAISNFFNSILYILILVWWMVGIVLSKSFWAIIPIYAWYVVVERVMDYYHLLGYGLP